MSDQILDVKAVYCVCYDGKPISIKSVNSLISDKSPKYRRVCFPESPGHAFNLVEKLNKLFRTDKFSVWELQPTKRIDRNGK